MRNGVKHWNLLDQNMGDLMINPLKKYREKKKMTIKELAFELNLTEPFLTNFLNGKNTRINIDLLIDICKFTKIPPHRFFEYRNSIRKEEERAA